MREIEIRTAPTLTVAGVAHRGPYMDIGEAYERMHALFEARGLYRPGQSNVAVYFDNARVTAPENCRSLAARSVADDAKIEPPLEKYEIASGECAVLRHRGPYAELGAAYDWLFGVWLPGSGREAADRPCYEIYFNTPMDAAPEDLITDIHLPLK